MKTNLNKNHFRQGDVAIARAASSEFTLVPVKPINNRLILAFGEATGHHHSISLLDYPKAELFTAKEQPATMMLYIPDAPVVVEHQEHCAIVLDPGWYQIERQIEYDPEVNERRVAD